MNTGTAICSASGSVKMWMCVISLFIGWMLGKFAIKRLIHDRVPPEVEVKEKAKNE